MVEMGTFVAILLGTIAGGLLVAVKPAGAAWASALTIVIAVTGWLASRRIPLTPAAAPELRINWNLFTETWRNLKIGHGNLVVWRSMLGISWFWFYGAIYLAQFPAFTRDVLGGDEHVFTLLLALFSIGIGTGSLLCERMSGRKVEIGLVPFGSIGLIAVRDRPVARDPARRARRDRRRRGLSRGEERTGASWSTSSCSGCSAVSTPCPCTR